MGASALRDDSHIASRTDAAPRIEAIDALRGIIIVLMALDHVHDFFGDQGIQPTNLDATTAALFFTRWITHFCAPVFFLLTGAGAWLMHRHRSKAEMSRFLVARGVWLIFLELVVMRFALQFNVDYHTTIITVLWALGWAMIVLAALLWLPMWAITTIGVLLVAGHDTLDGIPASAFGALAPLWTILHVPGPILDTGRVMVFVAYPLIPWVAVTALGYVLAQLYTRSTAQRRSWLLWLGAGLSLGFIVLRLLNVYGDPLPWSTQKSLLWTVMSFLDTNKYPPSLLFLLMTLGPALLLLRALDHDVPTWLRLALVFGKVPLFFFVLHFFLIHLLAVGASWLRYGTVSGLFDSPDLAHFPFSQPPGWGADLPIIYGLWLAVTLIMFPLCRWYAGLKRRRGDWWLSYL